MGFMPVFCLLVNLYALSIQGRRLPWERMGTRGNPPRVSNPNPNNNTNTNPNPDNNTDPNPNHKTNSNPDPNPPSVDCIKYLPWESVWRELQGDDVTDETAEKF